MGVLSLQAQNSFQVQNENGLPVPFAKVQTTCLNDQSESAFIGDKDGWVSLQSGCEDFILKLRAPGYEEFIDTIQAGQLNANIQLAKIGTLSEVCVTGEYQPISTTNSIQKVTIITADQIEKSGAVTLNEAIFYQTGIRISQDNILGSSMDLSGLSGQNVKILIDGVPVIGRQNGNIDLSQINMNNVERIEIVEGPLSIIYGTDALAGTINIITKKDYKSGIYLSLKPFYETVGNYNMSGVLTVSTQKHTVSVEGGRNYFDGWSASDPFIQFPASRPADTNRFKTWKPKEQYFFTTTYSTTFKTWKISPYVRYFDEVIINRGFPVEPYYEQAFDDYYYTTRIDYGARVNKEFKKGSFKANIASNNFDRIKNTWYRDLTTLNKVLSENPGSQDTIGFNLLTGRLNYASKFDGKFNFQLGLDLNYEIAEGARIEEGSKTIGDYAIYSSLVWQPIEQIKIKPGLRYAYNTVFESPLVPGLSLFFKHNKFSLRGSVARGFRAPTLKELYFNFVDINHNIVGNTDIIPEESWNYSASLSQLISLKEKQLIKLEYNVYYNQIENLITLGIMPDNSYTYINIGTYSTIGNGVTASYRDKKLNLSMAATYIGRYNPDAEEASIKPYSFSPEISLKAGYSLIDERLSISSFYKYNGALQSFYTDGEGAINLSEQAPFHILDASIQYKPLKKVNLAITVGAKNLLNVQQINISGVNQSTAHSSSSSINVGRGRSVFIGIKYDVNYKFLEKK